MRSNRGLITIDFLFAITMVMGFTVIFFSLSMTLTAIEVAQYATFTGARVYMAAPVEKDLEQRAARADSKFNQVTQNQYLGVLFSGNWFELRNLKSGDHNDDYPQGTDNPKLFWGTRVTLIAKVLDLQIPIYGSTSNSGDGEGFTTRVGSYLAREISSEECIDFNKERIKWIINLDSRFSNGASANERTYTVMADNGC